MTRLALVVGVVLFGGCESTDPCQDYVDYVCDCHADDPTYDCAELQTTFENPDSEVQNQCQLDLAALRKADEENGVVCAGTGTT
jgi:hypothetical protein